ncbi:trissin receptor-like [Anthonomus grandis grandis]|uniref:trissin receptor-like n=1 Tax=Anthonomus grandis grandis TaxID=2921223 RepID=UPI0021669ECC|nr:trissin receptor-like [Anthonomus grandis grandis]
MAGINTTPWPFNEMANVSRKDLNGYNNEDYVFDKTYIRIIFVSLYTVVFCLCFFGNLLVILVVSLSRRLRTTTNFFLANLALADFCVAIFCVYQNFLIYIVESWILGEFLCKMYIFIQSLSNSASIVILVVICTERYFAILYPITCKQILTTIRLKAIIVVVWATCILYSSPKFYWGNTVTVTTENSSETVCVLNRQKFDSKLFDVAHFALLYLMPLAIISLLYTRIAICLWNSSEQLKQQLDGSTNLNYYETLYPKCRQENQNFTGSENILRSSRKAPSLTQHPTANVLKARRGVIKMLIIVVCTFALCNLPFHARKLWQYWSPHYQGHTNFSALLTPLTFLSTYFNSGVNPLLYAFLSKNFRRGMRELLFCSHKTNCRQRNFRYNTKRCSKSTECSHQPEKRLNSTVDILVHEM